MAILQTNSQATTLAHQSLAFIALPWNAFIGAFLYYTLLTLIAVGGIDLSAGFMISAYAVVPVIYGAVLLTRAFQALASLRIDLFQTPHAAIR